MANCRALLAGVAARRDVTVEVARLRALVAEQLGEVLDALSGPHALRGAVELATLVLELEPVAASPKLSGASS